MEPTTTNSPEVALAGSAMQPQRTFTLRLPRLWKNPKASADQYRFINSRARFAIAATGTKTGKTLGCAEWLLEHAASRPRTLWWWIGPSYYQSRIGFDRVLSFLPPGRVAVDRSDLTIQLPNASRMEFKSGDRPNLLFGAAVHGAVMDEASRQREDTFSAVMSTLTQTLGPMRISSNTDLGKSNWFYPLYLKGYDTNFPQFESFSIKSYENPHLKEQAFRDLADTLNSVAYQALVEAVFPDDALNVFRGLERCILVLGERGRLPIIEEVLAGRRYVIGVDLAKKRDFTVITVIDTETRRIVYWLRMAHKLWETQIDFVAQLSAYYNRAQVLVDSTGVGDPIFERLQLAGVPVEGFQFSNMTKQLLVNRLALGIEHAELEIPACLEELIRELRAYEYNISKLGVVRYAAPGTEGHADSVMSLGLAYWAAANPFSVGYQSVTGRTGATVGAVAGARFDKAHRGF